MKITKESIQQMIMEEIGNLSEDFASDAFTKGFGAYSATDTQSGPDPLGATVAAADIFDTLKDKGSNPQKLDITDIQYFISNPEKITTPIQQKLIAISRAGGGGNSDKYDIETEKRKKRAINYMVYSNFKVGSLRTKADAEIIALAKKANPKNKTIKRSTKAYSSAKNTYLADIYSKDPPSGALDSERAQVKKAYAQRYDSWNFHSNGDNKAKLLAMAEKAEEALAALERSVAAAGQRKQTISSPEFKSQRGETGSFPVEQVAVVKRLLSGESTIEGRITKVSQIAKKYYDAATGDNDGVTALQAEALSDPKNILSEIQLLDLFNTMVKEIDSGSGAYVFEYFLALISGGQVLGKAKTDSGRMGAADFMMPGGELGSAKFYKVNTNVTQALSGYEDMYRKNQNQPVSVTYVVGLKKQDTSQISKLATANDQPDPTKAKSRKGLGTSDPARIIGIEIFTPKVTYIGAEKFTVNDGEPFLQKKDKVWLDNRLGDSKGFIYITEMRTRTFREMIGKAIDQTNSVMKEIFQQFKGYFDMLEQADESAKVYVAETDPAKSTGYATSVYKSLGQADKLFGEMQSAMDSPWTATASRAMADVAENKKNEINSLKALDKLIEQVILYKNTEEK